MEDLTGLGKLANSKLVNQIYEDGFADATEEAGKALTDLTKTFRLFTAPIQLLATAQDRLAAYCERVRSEVPEERQIEASPSVATPILLELRYMEVENPITEMYLNLLKCAVDRDRVGDAHPAFVKIIGQLSPDEAMILHHLKSNKIELVEYRKELRDPLVHAVDGSDYPDPVLAKSPQLSMFLEHLEFLNLVLYKVGEPMILGDLPLIAGFRQFKASAVLTQFGRLFVSACEPDGS
ncbi:hypothetical protein V6x_51510 [Gimesia chilikensis]|uniref:DUF4393 domain-containing protein n=1 Tax=Gimesia chilikensis TaxID=2605989 RepID=A0A517WJH8_9PLAN|nr:Abi-alpha family protein [Gimesia chilikensis]QDU05414.1 hypothetical protein V6x_51510 [Gimesia chilikensis]